MTNLRTKNPVDKTVRSSPEWKALTPKMRKFVENHLKGMSGKDAYIKAGYKPKSDNAAEVSASQLLRNPKVEKVLDLINKKVEEGIVQDAIMSRQEMAERLTTIGRADLAKIVTDSGEIDPTKVKSLGITLKELDVTYIETDKSSRTTRKVKLHDPQRAMDSLAKLMGYNEPEKHDVNVKGLGEVLEMIDGDTAIVKKEQ